MFFIGRILLISLILLIFAGCEGEKAYDVGSDKAVADMNTRIKSLDEDLTTLTSEIKQVKAVLKDKDIDTELKKSIKKEVLEGEKYKKEISQWLAYLKIQRKQRYNSLLRRKGQKDLTKEAKEEVEAYFLNKKLKPINKRWKDRYRTAIEL